jgi:hypothetical protein
LVVVSRPIVEANSLLYCHLHCVTAVQPFTALHADEADDGDEAFVPGTTAEAYGEDSDGYWWWQSTEA